MSATVLIVSYYFPPNAAVGGKRVARFSQYLPDFGIRPIVLTIDEASCGTPDLSLLSSTELQVERARPRTTLLDRYHQWAETRSRGVIRSTNDGMIRPSFTVRKRFLGLRDHVLALLQFPDMWNGWYRPAMRAANRIISRSRVDVVISSGPPWTAHAVGYSISHRHNIPWIADFRDAWTSDPWRSKYSYGPDGRPAWRDRLDIWTEHRWTRHAKLVICTTSQHRDGLLRSHPDLDENRVRIIPNGFESQRLDGARQTLPAERLQFLHIGHLYGGRRIDIFCQAVQSLVRKGRLSFDKTRIILMGDTDSHIEQSARDSSPDLFDSGIIAFHPRVEWAKAQQAIRDANVLLIFQGHHPTAIPAKFYEYLVTGKPIVAIVGEGALRDIVLQTGSGFVADPDNQSEIERVLEQSLEAEPREPDEIQVIAGEFDYRNLTSKLAKNIRQAANL